MKLTVNGVPREVGGSELRPLLHVLRDDLDITGPKAGCQQEGRKVHQVLADRRLVLGKSHEPCRSLLLSERPRFPSWLRVQPLEVAGRIGHHSSLPDREAHDTGDDAAAGARGRGAHMLVEVADEPVNEGRRDLGEPQGSKGRQDVAPKLALVRLYGSRRALPHPG